MKSSPKLRPNGWDALAAAAVLALAVACAALFWTGGEEIGPLTAVVSANGEPVDRVVLADLSGPGGDRPAGGGILNGGESSGGPEKYAP